MSIREDHLEQAALGWFVELGYRKVSGYDIAPDGETPERQDFRQVILTDRLRSRLAAINPGISPAAIEDAIRQIA
jgi:type I restriction enzyme R subunit